MTISELKRKPKEDLYLLSGLSQLVDLREDLELVKTVASAAIAHMQMPGKICALNKARNQKPVNPTHTNKDFLSIKASTQDGVLWKGISWLVGHPLQVKLPIITGSCTQDFILR